MFGDATAELEIEEDTESVVIELLRAAWRVVRREAIVARRWVGSSGILETCHKMVEKRLSNTTRRGGRSLLKVSYDTEDRWLGRRREELLTGS